jgi:hypothetical protein
MYWVSLACSLLLLVSCSVYFFALKMKEILSSKNLDLFELHGVATQKAPLFTLNHNSVYSNPYILREQTGINWNLI